ncbi:MAG: hypothetical protein FJ284_02490 [Planctomycetes bacterium]|nr:hypothetical protein [Planctomycetota bacterium]
MSRGWFPVILLGASLTAAGLRAGDDVVVDGMSAKQPAEAVRFAAVNVNLAVGQIVVGQGVGIRQVEYDLAAMFDQKVFRRGRAVRPVRIVGGRIEQVGEGTVGSDTLEGLAELRRRALTRIAILERVCGLGGRQRAVLELAVESDLRRLAGEIDQVRRKYAGGKLQASAQGEHRERFRELQDDALACRSRIEHVWRQGSLLSAVSRGALSSDQVAAFEDWLTARRATRWEAMVRMALGWFDESALGLSAVQHDALLARLLADVPPLVVFDDVPWGATASRAGDLQTMVVAERLGRLDKAELQRLFDARQWLAIEQFIGHYGSPEVLQQLLVEQGVLEEQP